jgi:small subunit ribosomal protein S35
MFEDIPLDTRHHTFKVKPRFPKEWRLTEERRKELEDTRQKALLLDETKEANGALVDGDERIQRLLKPAGSTLPIPERVPISIGIPSPRPAPRWQGNARR